MRRSKSWLTLLTLTLMRSFTFICPFLPGTFSIKQPLPQGDLVDAKVSARVLSNIHHGHGVAPVSSLHTLLFFTRSDSPPSCSAAALTVR